MTSHERFEAYLRTRGYFDADFEKTHGHYSLYALNMQFDGWQAAEAATAQRIAELEAENKTLRAAQKACEACDEGLFAESEAIRAERDALKAALVQIAAYEEGPVVNSGFDEPAAAQTARNALDAAKGKK